MKPLWDLIQQQLKENNALTPKSVKNTDSDDEPSEEKAKPRSADHMEFFEDRQLQENVQLLSQTFTEGRRSLGDNYMGRTDFARAYIAYFLPLNFEKTRLLLSSHSGVWPKDMPYSDQHWLDLGCGPGTAILAALASFKDRYKKSDAYPVIHVTLVDHQPKALQIAREFVTAFAEKLGLEVIVKTFKSLKEVSEDLGNTKGKIEPTFDLTIAANMLNELPAETSETAKVREPLLQLWDFTKGVTLVLEPGHRVSSQRLVRFRERLVKNTNVRILGPCKHVEKCPVNRTNNWCHFSEPVRDGRLIDLNLRVFKDPRSWLKFSYILATRGEMPKWDGYTYRAIGDLHPTGGQPDARGLPKRMAIDLCAPGSKFSFEMPPKLPPELRETLVRGATVTLSAKKAGDKEEENPEILRGFARAQIVARPMSKREKRTPTEHENLYHREKKAAGPRVRDDDREKRGPRGEPRKDARPPRRDYDERRPRSEARPSRGGPAVKPLAKPIVRKRPVR